MRLHGARCLVVGGARRLGRELAADLAAGGARVALTSRDAGDAERAAAALGRPPHAIGLAADTVTAEGARAAVRDAVRALGGLDAVVYTASGAFVPTPPQEIDESAWDASFDVVARGFFFTACAARDVMVGEASGGAMRPGGGDPRTAAHGGESGVATQDGRPGAAAHDGGPGAAAHDGGPGAAPATRGAIVAVTDLLGIQAWAAIAAHGAAKAAHIHHVKMLARAWAPDGVRVCGVAPGPVDLVDDERRDAALRTAAKGATGRLVAPAQVAAAVRFCVENDAVTGVNVIVDAGALVTS
jgi:NAD(P)-dependent dehydrogenase (short-subunit alcohol dehydrogenase family)